MEGRGNGVMTVWSFSFDLLHIQIGDRRQSTAVIRLAYDVIYRCLLIRAVLETDLWVTVSTMARDFRRWMRGILDDVRSRIAPTSLGLLM